MNPENAIDQAKADAGEKPPRRCLYEDTPCTRHGEDCQPGPCLADKRQTDAHNIRRLVNQIQDMAGKIETLEKTTRKPKGHG